MTTQPRVQPPPRPRFVWRQKHWAALLAAGRNGDKSAAKLAAELAKSDDFKGPPAAVLNSSTVRREWAKIQAAAKAAGDTPPPDLLRSKTEPDWAQLKQLMPYTDPNQEEK